jgi:16S rRNA (adenine1518-N6/adenine1519-N6)-dimethyltransferase
MPHRYKKQYGQHFLNGDRFAHKLIEPLDIQEGDLVIEIGPGDGRVTNILLHKKAKVVAIEVDYDLIPKLIMRFKDKENFQLIHKDVLKVDLEEVFNIAKLPNSTPYKVVGSLPYNIYKDIVAKYLKVVPKPSKLSFILQEEVAQNYTAKPPKALYLSNWVQMFSHVRKLESIPKSQFFPRPKVDGAILVMTPFEDNRYDLKLDTLIQLGFSNPRKTLSNNVSRVYGQELVQNTLREMGINEKVRAAEIGFDTWKKLLKILDKSDKV